MNTQQANRMLDKLIAYQNILDRYHMSFLHLGIMGMPYPAHDYSAFRKWMFSEIGCKKITWAIDKSIPFKVTKEKIHEA